jgi:hypothetical protein
MIEILFVTAFALFAEDNAEFIADVDVKYEQGCTFTYVGKKNAKPDVPHISWGDYVFYSMEPCDE